MTYGEYLRKLSRINPIDYQDAGTQAHLEGAGVPLDDLRARATGVMLARLIRFAPEDALLLIGEERGLQRYPGEYLAAYRHRVANAWEFWRWAGTVRGMLYALEHMGYGVRLSALDGNIARGVFSSGVAGGLLITQASGDPVRESTYTLTLDGEVFEFPTLIVPDNYRYYELPPTRIIEHYQDDQSIWAEFSLYLTPADASLNADAWDDGSRWDDGTLWDLTIRQEELNRVISVVNEIKPGHARLRGVYLVSQWGQDYWDDGLNWDDGTLWDAQRPTTLYLREGA